MFSLMKEHLATNDSTKNVLQKDASEKLEQVILKSQKLQKQFQELFTQYSLSEEEMTSLANVIEKTDPEAVAQARAVCEKREKQLRIDIENIDNRATLRKKYKELREKQDFLLRERR